MRLDVRIRTALSCGSGVHGRPRHHRRNRQQEPAGDRLRVRQTLLEDPQAVLRTAAWYTKPGAVVHRVCDHPAQNIALQKQITDVQTQQFLPPECDHSTIEEQLETLKQELQEASRIPRMVRTDEDLRQVPDGMTRDARQSGEEVRALRTQLANARFVAAPVAPTPPQQPYTEDRRFPTPRIFRIGLSSVDRLGCSTPNVHTTQARQLS